MELVLNDKFNYPTTMLEFSSFADYANVQPAFDDYDDSLLIRLNGLTIGDKVEVNMFNDSKTVDTPYQKFDSPEGWEEAFESKTSIHELEIIKKKLIHEWRKGNIIFPLEPDIFDAFKHCKPSEVKVVIIGQDPYPQMDSKLGVPIANGKSFSLRHGGDDTGSLTNIFTEIKRTFPGIPLEHGDLTSWAKQGVLLLNSQLTVVKDDPGSHTKLKVWDYWTSYIIKWICDNCPGVIFLLWGAKALSFTLGDMPAIGKKIFKLTCGHPSNKNTSSAAFHENGHFAALYFEIQRQNKVIEEKNIALAAQGSPLLKYKEQINWTLVHPEGYQKPVDFVDTSKKSTFNLGAMGVVATKNPVTEQVNPFPGQPIQGQPIQGQQQVQRQVQIQSEKYYVKGVMCEHLENPNVLGQQGQQNDNQAAQLYSAISSTNDDLIRTQQLLQQYPHLRR